MASTLKRLGVAALAAVVLWALAAAPARAQVRIMPTSSLLVNPAYRVGPLGTPLNQLAYNTAVMGNAMSQVPPWVSGFNPYPQNANYGPVYNPQIGYNPLPQVGGTGVGGTGVLGTGTGGTAILTSGQGGLGGSGGSLVNNPYNSSYNSLYNNPYNSSNYNGYYPSPYSNNEYNPLGYTLQGAAAAINSQGQFNIQNQRAKLEQQQVEQSKVDTRRKIYDEWLYEQANMPTLQDRREQTQRYELRRAMKDPPLPEILNGSSLDAVYKDLLGKQPQWPKGPVLNVDENVLQHVNLTSRTGGNVGLLKKLDDGQALPWPGSLKLQDYKNEVERINQRLQDAVRMAKTKGSVDGGTLANMRDDLRALQGKVTANINDLTPSDTIAAKRFLNQLEDALTALQQPDIGDHLTGKFAAKGKTVSELLQYMSSKGLSFGPATTGDEAAYVALLNYLVGYNAALGGSSPP